MSSPARNSLQNKYSLKEIVELKTVPLDFYSFPTPRVAKNLLGKGLFVLTHNIPLLAEIVEVEAYLGEEDPASHAYRGMTKRNASMFAKAGTSYVYLSYGVNFCVNVTTRKAGIGEAVLLRAAFPINGIEQMHKNRGLPLDNSARTFKNLLSGPGKLTQGFGINLRHNGITFDRQNFRIVELNRNYSSREIVKTSRIGISRGIELPLRFFLKSCEFVSRRN